MSCLRLASSGPVLCQVERVNDGQGCLCLLVLLGASSSTWAPSPPDSVLPDHVALK